MRRRNLLSVAGLCAGSGWLSTAHADDAGFRLIVHPSNALRSAPDTWLADLFLKKITRWPEGEVTRPADQKPGSAVRRAFSEQVLRRSVGAVRSYWQQRIFSGRDVPPPELDSDEAVVAFVAKYPGAIGYVAAATKLVGVRELAVK